MSKKINNHHGIKSPKSVEEFRNNLGKHFWTLGDEGKKLYVSYWDGSSDFFDIDKISSFDDIYKLSGDNLIPPSICPKMDMVKDGEEFMKETGQVFSFNGYFLDEKNYNLVDDQWDCKEPKWYKLDNQMMREFFMITLGHFSGYEMEVQ